MLANAMALRPQGVTGSEIVIACGAPQLNRMRGLVSDGVFKREPHDPRNGHTVYKMVLTPKGEKAVAKAESAPAPDTGDAKVKPAKVTKAKRKPRKAPATPAGDSPVPLTAAQAEAVTVPAGDAPQAEANTAPVA